MTKAQKALKARRSAAAKKGWEMRRHKIDAAFAREMAAFTDALNPQEVAAYLAKQTPNPWTGIADAVSRGWARMLGWFR